MPIRTGTQLSSYKVLARIGAGGMGEVYEAHDTKLGRNVAIKVLPETFAEDADRLARFQREAKMLAALNHPNIATIHGLEQSNGAHYLVMELVAGETLRQRVANEGPLRLEEALKIAVQIAEALEAAHEKGIIHRDLKPANVKVTPEGKVKVLDFGLAKAFADEELGSDPSNSPTVSTTPTMPGVILGTAAYMSPEQARGKAVDKRTDIWAFGCVLYELLTGKQVFEGETVPEILAAVLKEEPDWLALPPSTPAQICGLLRRCLQKDRTLRFRDAGDARIEIQEALIAPIPAGPVSAAASQLRGWRQVAAVAIAALALLAIGSLATWNLKPSPSSQPITRTVIDLPPGQQLAGLENGPAIALSPDGTRLAYVARQGGTQQIYLRPMDSLESKPIPGTEGAVSPFFSPDGQLLGFFAGGKLMRVSISGGPALTLNDSVNPRGASWGSQGTIAFGLATNSALLQVPDAGGTPQPLTRLEKGEPGHRWPEFLPGGKALIFTAGANPLNFTNAQVAVQSVGTSQRRNLIQGGMYPRYAPSGHLVYAQGGSLIAVSFDPQRLAVTGMAVSVVEGVRQSPIDGDAQYSFSATGSLVYASGGPQAIKRKVVWVDRKGVEQVLTAAPARAYRYPRLSPDGRRMAVIIEESEANIWLYDLRRETLTRLTFEGDLNLLGAWTPDGKRIAFQSNKEGTPNVFWQLADGNGGMERLTTGEYRQSPNSWSPDGQLMAFIEVNPNTGYDIWILRLSDRKAQPFLRTPFNEGAPRFSPDGRWLAYTSDESGRPEVYVQPYPGPGGKWQISTEGGTEPVWNPNGRELFYRSGDRMTAVDIATQPSFAAGKPQMLFEGQYAPSPVMFPNYDVTLDGQHFLMLKPTEQVQSVPNQINVVLNWFEELKQKVPTGKK